MKFTFKTEATWLTVLYILVPVLAIIFALVIPMLMRR